MSVKRILCHNCPSFDDGDRRCKLGKVNPRKKHESFTAVELMGPQALCLYNPWRESLLIRMYFPKQPFLASDKCQLRTMPLELEWLDANGNAKSD